MGQEETTLTFPNLLTPLSTESQKTAMQNEELFQVHISPTPISILESTFGEYAYKKHDDWFQAQFHCDQVLV